MLHSSVSLHSIVMVWGWCSILSSSRGYGTFQSVTAQHGRGGGMMNDQGATAARLLPNGCLLGGVLVN